MQQAKEVGVGGIIVKYLLFLDLELSLQWPLREVLRALESYFIYLPFYHTLIYFIGNGQCQLESGNLMDCLSLQGEESPFLLSFLQVLR